MGLLTSDIEAVVIQLDRVGQPFATGDVVEGSVLVTTQKAGVKVQKIHLDITGVTDIAFSHTKGSGKKKKTQKCTKRQEFFKEVINLMNEEKVLDVGVTPYKFNFKLPDDARTSFKGKFGSIEYLAKAFVDIPWGKDGEGTLVLHVNKLNDLNTEMETLEKAEAQHQKTFGVLCFKSPPVTTNLVVNKSGFVCGEVMKVNVKVDNSSNKLIKEVQMHLTQVVTYHAENHSKTEEIVIIDSKDLGEVPPGNNEVIDHLMEIPEIGPTQEDKNSINIQYKLRIDVIPDGFSLDGGGAETEITIGNIPHKVAFSTFEPDPEGSFQLHTEVMQKYPSVPNYRGTNHITYTAK